MSVEINKTNTAIELSEQELDLVAGGAISDAELAAFNAKQNNFASVLTAGPTGVISGTTASQTQIASLGIKTVSLS